jgi:HD-like signal output (HDOD) protein
MALFGGRKRGEPWKELGDFELPQFSETTLQALDVLRSEESAANEVADVISRDPGLSVRVLSMVNSAAFGARIEVEDLAHATQLVGRAALERLIISLAVKDALPADAPGLKGGNFWQVAMRRGLIARRLAGVLCPAEANMCFTAAMLSDMAVPLLALRVGKPYADVLARRDAGEAELCELEFDTFGWDHAQVGAWMSEQWELPDAMTASIRVHHSGEAPRDPVALAGLLDEVDPEKDASRVAEIGAEDWDTRAAALEAEIFSALEEAESKR